MSLGIEFSGILHICYMIERFVSWVAGKPFESNEPPRTLLQNVFFYARVLMSLALLGIASAVTFTAIFEGKTTVWESVPPAASVVIFFVLMGCIGVLEGSQIAYFAVVKMQKSEQGQDGSMGWFAKKSACILFKNHNHNLAAFLVGRQLCVVSCMFFIARITAVQIEPGEENIFGVSDWVQGIFSTGLLGALIVAVVASVSWRLLANAFPLAFFKNPLAYIFLRLCLVLEMTGILHGAWVIAYIIKKLTGVVRDEKYIGTAEERAERAKRKDAIKNFYPKGEIMRPSIRTCDIGDDGPPTVDLSDVDYDIRVQGILHPFAKPRGEQIETGWRYSVDKNGDLIPIADEEGSETFQKDWYCSECPGREAGEKGRWVRDHGDKHKISHDQWASQIPDGSTLRLADDSEGDTSNETGEGDGKVNAQVSYLSC